MTVWNTKVAAFLCPSDTQSQGIISTSGGYTYLNNYYGSYGTGTNPWSTQTNGIFAPEQTAYSIAAVTDGTSNTICHVEGLAGSVNNYKTPWRSYVSGVLGTVPCSLLLNDARMNLPAVMAVANQCVQMINSGNYGTNNDRGLPLADRLAGVKPDYHHHPAELVEFSHRRLPVGLQRGLRHRFRPHLRAEQQPPRRRERPVR